MGFFSTNPYKAETPADRTTPESISKDAQLLASDGQLSCSSSETGEKQAGVKRIEAISKSWTTASLVIAYVTYDTAEALLRY